MKDYFQGGWSDANLKLLADYDAWTKKEPSKGNELGWLELEDYLWRSGNVGDTRAVKLFEDEKKLIYLFG